MTMHVISPDHFDDADAESYKIRSTVKAVPCPGGAQLTDDKGNVTASYGDDCYVVEGSDGDHRIVSRYVFDGLYEPSDGSDEDEAFDDSYDTGEPDDGNAAVPTPEQGEALDEAARAAATQGGGQQPTQQQDAQGQQPDARQGSTQPTRPAKATQPAKTTPARGGRGGRGGRR